MNRICRAWIPILITVLCAFAGPSWAGVVLVDGSGNRTFVSGGKMKSVTEGDTQTIIFDVNGEVLTFVDHEKTSYAQGTIDEFCEEASSLMGAALEGMSAEEKAMMEQLLGRKMDVSPPEVSVSNVGSGGSVAGLDTTRYEVYVDGALYEEIWISEDPALIQEFSMLKKMVDMSGKMAGCMGGPMGGAYESSPESTPAYIELLKKGYPMKVVSHGEGAPEEEEHVIEVTKQPIPDSEFQPPKGYEKITFKDLMGGNE